MTVIYVPRLIESAEQAEALPLGTVVLEVLTEPGEEERVIGADFIDDGFDEDLTPGGNWHHVALVPIEAEEETSVVVWAAGSRDYPYSEASMDSDGNVWFGDDLRRVDVTDEFNEWAKRHTRTRLVTPWEDA